MNKFYVYTNGQGWFVKEAKFFEEQGGLTENWGRMWWPIEATSIEDARERAAKTIQPLNEG